MNVSELRATLLASLEYINDLESLLRAVIRDPIESADHVTLVIPRTLYDEILKEVDGGE